MSLLGADPLISLNSIMFITVVLAPFRGSLDSRLNSDAPGKSMVQQNITNFWHFWPSQSENKYPTTPLFYDLLIMVFICHQETWKIPKKYLRSLGMWPLPKLTIDIQIFPQCFEKPSFPTSSREFYHDPKWWKSKSFIIQSFILQVNFYCL